MKFGVGLGLLRSAQSAYVISQGNDLSYVVKGRVEVVASEWNGPCMGACSGS